MTTLTHQHASDPYSQFTTGVASELMAGGRTPDKDAEIAKSLKELTASFALTNKLLAITYGGGGVGDRRSGQTYYIDVGFTLADVSVGDAFADANIMVNTTRISELVSPSMGEVDVKFNIGVDSFSLHRYKDPTPVNQTFPISVVCDKLQSSSNARYLTTLSGESGTALSGTAQSVFFGEIPSSLEFRIGFLSPIPVDSNGVLNRTLFPIAFGPTWKDTAEGLKAPRVPNSNNLLWNSSEIYSMSLRLYVIPTITPRVRVMSE